MFLCAAVLVYFISARSAPSFFFPPSSSAFPEPYFLSPPLSLCLSTCVPVSSLSPSHPSSRPFSRGLPLTLPFAFQRRVPICTFLAAQRHGFAVSLSLSLRSPCVFPAKHSRRLPSFPLRFFPNVAASAVRINIARAYRAAFCLAFTVGFSPSFGALLLVCVPSVS